MTDAEAKESQEFTGDLPSLRSKLEELRKKKEEWFEKKESLKQEIADLIKQIKGIKNQSDSSSKSISELKAERDRCNEDVRRLIQQFKKLSKEKRDKLSKGDVRLSPAGIRSQIEKLELKIETEAPSFDQEKKLMKQIKGLKKQLEESKELGGVFEKMDSLSKEIDEAKAKAEEFHRQLKERLSTNKKGYSEFRAASKKINELKGVQEQAFENFTKYKKEFSDLNRVLVEKYKVKDSERREKVKKREEGQKQKRAEDEKKLKEKAEEVEKKLKSKGGKKVLTTEDLLAFQGTIEN